MEDKEEKNGNIHSVFFSFSTLRALLNHGSASICAVIRPCVLFVLQIPDDLAAKKRPRIVFREDGEPRSIEAPLLCLWLMAKPMDGEINFPGGQVSIVSARAIYGNTEWMQREKRVLLQYRLASISPRLYWILSFTTNREREREREFCIGSYFWQPLRRFPIVDRGSIFRKRYQRGGILYEPKKGLLSMAAKAAAWCVGWEKERISMTARTRSVWKMRLFIRLNFWIRR